jgi:hypothetical protein
MSIQLAEKRSQIDRLKDAARTWRGLRSQHVRPALLQIGRASISSRRVGVAKQRTGFARNARSLTREVVRERSFLDGWVFGVESVIRLPVFSLSGTMKHVVGPHGAGNTGYLPAGKRFVSAVAYRRRSPSRDRCGRNRLRAVVGIRSSTCARETHCSLTTCCAPAFDEREHRVIRARRFR